MAMFISSSHGRKYIKIFLQTLQSLSKQKFRTFLSVLGIIIGVASVIAMLAVGEGAKQEVLRQIEQMGANSLIVRNMNPDDGEKTPGLTNLDLNALQHYFPPRKVSASKDIEEKLNPQNMKLNEKIVAVSPNYKELRNLQLQEGRFICDLDVKERHHVCVLGYEIAKGLGVSGSGSGRVEIDQKPFKIAGILSPRETQKENTVLSAHDYNHMIFLPFGIDETFGKQNAFYQTVSEMIVKVPSKEDLGTASKIIKNVLLHNHQGAQDFQIIIPQELLAQQQKTQKTFHLVLGAIAGISLLVGGIGIMNIMLAIITERIKEIGIRRALGANQTHIMKQFLIEAAVLTAIGSFFGVFLGITAGVAISFLTQWKIAITLWSILLSMGVSTIVGIISGLYPALKSASIDPILALRHD